MTTEQVAVTPPARNKRSRCCVAGTTLLSEVGQRATWGLVLVNPWNHSSKSTVKALSRTTVLSLPYIAQAAQPVCQDLLVLGAERLPRRAAPLLAVCAGRRGSTRRGRCA